jgi:hypothetical protein
MVLASLTSVPQAFSISLWRIRSRRMLPENPPGDGLWAITVAVIYFGSVIAFGAIARIVCARLMGRYGVELSDVQEQAGTNRRELDVFLLGAWRKEK